MAISTSSFLAAGAIALALALALAAAGVQTVANEQATPCRNARGLPTGKKAADRSLVLRGERDVARDALATTLAPLTPGKMPSLRTPKMKTLAFAIACVAATCQKSLGRLDRPEP